MVGEIGQYNIYIYAIELFLFKSIKKTHTIFKTEDTDAVGNMQLIFFNVFFFNLQLHLK